MNRTDNKSDFSSFSET